MKKSGIYFNIIREIALTDLKLRYQGSIVGYLWTLMKPLFLFTVMYFVFTKFLRIGGNIPYYPVYLLLGIVIWTFFAEVTSICMGSIVGKGDLIRKVYFPRILLVLANSLSSFVVFLLNLVIVFLFMAFNHVPFRPTILLFPLLLIEIYIFALGTALLLSSLYVKYRDISHVWEVFMQAFFYATPILYPIAIVPVVYAKLIMLSPIAQVIQDSRYILITNQALRVKDILHIYWYIPYLIPLVVFVMGYYTFNKMSVRFAEEL